MWSLASTIQNARNPFPDLYQRYYKVCKKLTKLRKVLRDNTRQTARKDYFHTAPALEVDRQIKQLLSKSDAKDCDADSAEDGNEDWQPPILEYIFPERAWLVEAFYGPGRRVLMRINCWLDASKLPRIWLLFCTYVNQISKANKLTGMKMVSRVRNMKRRKHYRLKKNPLNVPRMCVSSVAVYPVAHHQILLFTSFH